MNRNVKKMMRELCGGFLIWIILLFQIFIGATAYESVTANVFCFFKRVSRLTQGMRL